MKMGRHMGLRISVLIGFVVLAIAFWVGPHDRALAAADPEQSKAYFDEAKDYLTKGDVDAAVIQLKNAIKSDPDNALARVMLAEIYVRSGVGDAAEKEIRAAIRRGYADPAAVVTLGRAMLLQRKFQETLDEVPADQADPAIKSEALIVRALASLGLDRTDEALASLTEAQELGGDNVRVYVALAELRVKRGELGEAETAIDKALALEPGLVDARVVKGELRRLAKDLPGAVDHFGQVLAVDGRNARALLGRAAAYIDLGEFDKATSDVNVLLADIPDQPLANFLLAMVRAKQNDLPGARDALQAAGPRIEDYMPGLFLLAAIDYAQGQIEQAIERLERYVRTVPTNSQAWKLLAASHLRREANDEAIAILEPMAERGPNDPQVLTLLGTAYLRTGRFAEANDLFGRAVELAPDAAALRLQLAMSQVAGGDLSAAAGQLNTAIELDPDQSQAQVLLVLVKLREKKFDEAIAAIDGLAKTAPDNPLTDNLRGAALLGKGDVAGARASFEAALAKEPGFAPAALNLAQIDAQEGKPADAMKRYEGVLAADPKRNDARLALAGLLADAGNVARAEAVLEEGVEVDPNNLTPRLNLAEFLGKQNRLDDALAVMREASLQFPDDVRAYRALGITLRAMGDHPGAIDAFARWSELAPDSADALFALAQAQASAGQIPGAVASIKRAMVLAPESLELRVAEVELAVLDKRFDEAATLATAIRDEYPDLPTGYVLLGNVKVNQGAYADAAPLYDEALKRENDPTTAVRRFEALRLAGQLDVALTGLAGWVADNPGNQGVEFTLAAAYLDSGNYDEATRWYEALTNVEAPSAVGLNNLAWLYQERGDPRAVATAEKAMALAPDEPAVIDTLAWILVENGDTERALPLLRRASSLAPQHAEIRYHLAAALAKAGLNEESCRELGDALGLGGDFSAVEDARQLSKDLSCS